MSQSNRGTATDTRASTKGDEYIQEIQTARKNMIDARKRKDDANLEYTILDKSGVYDYIQYKAAGHKADTTRSEYNTYNSILQRKQKEYKKYLLVHVKYLGKTTVRKELTEMCDMTDQDIDLLIDKPSVSNISRDAPSSVFTKPAKRQIEYRAYMNGKLIDHEYVEKT